MAFFNKIKWVLGILMVFVLIITTNLIDRNNFLRVKDSVTTIYEDRLIANDLIFEILSPVHEKEVAIALSDSSFFSNKNAVINSNIQGFIKQFEQTKLTREEQAVFSDLKRNISDLKVAETAYVDSGFSNKNEVLSQISAVNKNLYELSKIQLNEGSRQISISNRAIETVELYTQIEIYFLIFLAIVVQIIVMYNPKKKGVDESE
ncbi:Four helix bundle sensory module for signal transduction [Bizionia echini]|uniref:Four helix bundle sensory module for signal transduction n=1 Tax=Bizionia echini TaxID=649333 RepID=A0A1I5DAD7_9FLAO|nr:MCP four helix bundle domain-containing protein [Bizionia echini]SFN96077.1 Four helix bundle sensory module for signal transduction [Bizionia echini]